MNYIDCHMHMFSSQSAKLYKELTGKETFNLYPVEAYTAERLTGLLDEAGLKQGFALSYAYLFAPGIIQTSDDEIEYVKRENDYVIDECKKSQGRLIPFFSVNPIRDYAVDEIARCCSRISTGGLKLHFANPRIDIYNDFHLKKIKEVFYAAHKYDIPILLHFRGKRRNFGSKECEIFFKEIVEKIPVKLIIAHLGGWGGFDDVTFEITDTIYRRIKSLPIEQSSKIFLDVSGVVITKREVSVGTLFETKTKEVNEINDFFKKLGLNRILFGSDWPFITPKKYLENFIRVLDISEEDAKTILMNNPFV